MLSCSRPDCELPADRLPMLLVWPKGVPSTGDGGYLGTYLLAAVVCEPHAKFYAANPELTANDIAAPHREAAAAVFAAAAVSGADLRLDWATEAIRFLVACGDCECSGKLDGERCPACNGRRHTPGVAPV